MEDEWHKSPRDGKREQVALDDASDSSGLPEMPDMPESPCMAAGSISESLDRMQLHDNYAGYDDRFHTDTFDWPRSSLALAPIGEEPATEWAIQVSSEIAEIAKKHSSGCGACDSQEIADAPREEGEGGEEEEEARASLDFTHCHQDSAADEPTPRPGACNSSLEASQLQEVLALIAALVQQVQRVEQELHAHLDTQLTSLSLREELERRELGHLFAEALDMERKVRMQKMAELHKSVANSNRSDNVISTAPYDMSDNTRRAMADQLAESARMEVDRMVANARQEWDTFAGSLVQLRGRILEDVTERHAQAALDLAERHLEASRALDARAGELAELQARMVNGGAIADSSSAGTGLRRSSCQHSQGEMRKPIREESRQPQLSSIRGTTSPGCKATSGPIRTSLHGAGSIGASRSCDDRCRKVMGGA